MWVVRYFGCGASASVGVRYLPEGEAQIVEVTKAPGARLGVKLEKVKSTGAIKVDKLTKNSLLLGKVEVGDVIKQVNGKECSCAQAAKEFRKSTELKLLVRPRTPDYTAAERAEFARQAVERAKEARTSAKENLTSKKDEAKDAKKKTGEVYNKVLSPYTPHQKVAPSPERLPNSPMPMQAWQ